MTAATACVILSGCASSATEPDVPDGLATRETQDDAGDSAQLAGVVAEIDGCFYIDEPDGERWVAVFPTDIVEGPSAGEGFSLNGEDYTEGDDIVVGGSAAQLITYPVPDQCDEDVQQWQVHPEG